MGVSYGKVFWRPILPIQQTKILNGFVWYMFFLDDKLQKILENLFQQNIGLKQKFFACKHVRFAKTDTNPPLSVVTL